MALNQIRRLPYLAATLFNRLVPAYVFRARYFVVFSVKADEIAKVRRSQDSNRGIEFRWCDSAPEREAARQLSRIPVDAANDISQCKAAVLKLDGEMAAAVWFAQQKFLEDEIGLKILLDESSWWGFSAMVNKSHRGQGLFPALYQNCCDQIFQHGGRNVLAAVNPINRSSMNAFRKMKAERTAAAFVIRFFRFAVCVPLGKCVASRRTTGNLNRCPLEIRMESLRSD